MSARILAVWIDEGGEGPCESPDFFAAVSRLLPGQASMAVLVAGPAPRPEHAAHALEAGAVSAVSLAHPGLAVPAQAEQWLAVLQPVLAGQLFDLAVFPAGGLGEELAARLAVRMKGVALGVCSGITLREGVWTAARPLLGGRMQAVVEFTPGACFMAMRAQKAPQALGRRASAPPQDLLLDHDLPQAMRVELRPLEGARRPLEHARIIISGGRGVDEQGFALLQRLADALGAALGGSLPAVDAGCVPVSHQVGQSGKHVAPELYVAVGISGTPQHLAGIAPHSRIIAVNKDAEAGIFSRAAVGVVADWKLLLPALLARLRA